jgi:hypothetical protein
MGTPALCPYPNPLSLSPIFTLPVLPIPKPIMISPYPLGKQLSTAMDWAQPCRYFGESLVNSFRPKPPPCPLVLFHSPILRIIARRRVPFQPAAGRLCPPSPPRFRATLETVACPEWVEAPPLSSWFWIDASTVSPLTASAPARLCFHR